MQDLHSIKLTNSLFVLVYARACMWSLIASACWISIFIPLYEMKIKFRVNITSLLSFFPTILSLHCNWIARSLLADQYVYYHADYIPLPPHILTPFHNPLWGRHTSFRPQSLLDLWRKYFFGFVSFTYQWMATWSSYHECVWRGELLTVPCPLRPERQGTFSFKVYDKYTSAYKLLSQ